MGKKGTLCVKFFAEKKTNPDLFAALCRQLLFGLRFLMWEEGGKRRGKGP